MSHAEDNRSSLVKIAKVVIPNLRKSPKAVAQAIVEAVGASKAREIVRLWPKPEELLKVAAFVLSESDPETHQLLEAALSTRDARAKAMARVGKVIFQVTGLTAGIPSQQRRAQA